MSKRWKEKHPEDYKKYLKKWKIEHKGYDKIYYKKHKEAIDNRHKKYRKKHKKKYQKQRQKNYCKHKVREKKYRENYHRKYPEKRKNYQLIKKYNITLNQYNELLKKQNNCCAICNTNQSEFKPKFAVDHNHETDQVRGLLCIKCNSVIGYAKDSIEILDKAKVYLNNYNNVIKSVK